MDIGDTLRRARTRKRLTLDEVSRSLKIPVHILDDIENNAFERLPAAIYTRSFLRQYARQVDVDPEETVQEYVEQFTTPSAPSYAAPEPSAETPLQATAEQRHVRTIVINPRHLSVPALVAAVLALAFVSYLVFGSRAARTAGEAAVAPASAESDASQAVAAASAPDATHAANVVPEALRVELKVSGPCWISATTDRAPALSRLLQAGENQSLEAKDELVLRVGDPGTVSVTINGIPARPLGAAGQPVTVQINKQNYRELLAS